MDALIALLALTAMEIVLGIDNIVFIAILTDRLPAAQQSKARRLGLALALVSRIALLSTISWVMNLTTPLFSWTDLGLPASLFHIEAGAEPSGHALQMLQVSWRDIILFTGGLFLMWKTVREIHEQFDHGSDHHGSRKQVTFSGVLMQIMVLDVIFSLDSVITAVGMADELWVMVTAVVLAVGVMIVYANHISRFVSQHPTLKMLALSFLMLIGVMLVAESVGTHVEKGYVYFAMAFSLIVELLNMKVRSRHTAHRVAADD